MANTVNLKNNANVTRTGVVGFSWTTFFFGPLVPLFRGDWKWFIIMLITSFFTLWFSIVILSFIYNKIYTRSLLENGYFPADEHSRQLLVQADLITQVSY